ncbi:MAG: TonB-dependent receptor [Agriterribacter sp.]
MTSKFVAAQEAITFQVKNKTTSEPIAGASVVQKNTQHFAITDSSGYAIIKSSDSVRKIFTIESLGFVTATITLQSILTDSLYTVYLETQEAYGALETVTISTLRTNSRLENSPTPVEILGADEMNEENGIKPGNIVSLLGDIAGVQMQQVSASSGNTYARIQGLNGRYTQLLKDGMPLFGGLSGNFGIMQIPPLDLKQIEIIKGAASTLYGGDAIGGIINLISKNPTEKQELSATLNRTTLKETNINAYAAKRYKKFGYTFTATQTFQKAVDVDNDGLSDVPNVTSTVIHPKFIFYLSPRSTLTLNYTATFDKRQGGDMNYFSAHSPALYHINNNMQRHAGDAKWQYNFSPESNLVVKFSNSSVNQNMDTKPYRFKANQWIYYSEISYLHKYTSTDWVGGINFNGDIFRNTSANLPALQNYSYNTIGAFVQNTWHITNHFTTEAGLRMDHHSAYGNFVLPRLALLYKFSRAFTMRLNGGFGYKTPVLLNYIDPETDLNIVSVSRSLQTELSKGLNTDINYHTVFANDIDLTLNQSFFFTNLSKPVYDSSTSNAKINLLNANAPIQVKGLHTYIRVQVAPWEVYLGYVYTDVHKKYDELHAVLPVTPKHNFSTILMYEHAEKWRTGIESSFIAGQVDENYMPVKNYLLVATMFQYNINHFSFVLNGENLLDFRQSKYGRIYSGTTNEPVFHALWAPIDGRVINLSVKWSL